MRPVRVSKQDDQQAVVGSGVQAGEQVVTTGFGRLADGTKVEVSAADAAAPPPDSGRRGGPTGGGAGQGKGRPQGAAGAPGATPGSPQRPAPSPAQ